MFLLSIILIPISKDSDSNSTNNSLSVLASAEQKVKELEALYTTLITGVVMDQELYYTPIPGVDTNDPAAVKAELDKARAYVQQLISEGELRTEDLSDLEARVSEIQRRLPTTDKRLSDLYALLDAISTGTTLLDSSGRPLYISGVNNSDPVAIQAEIQRALTYQEELKSIEGFWQVVLDGRTQASTSTPPPSDLNGNGGSTTTTIPSWQFYLGEDIRLDTIADVRLKKDLEGQKAESEQRIKYLEGRLEEFSHEKSKEDTPQITSEMNVVQKELSMEKIRYARLDLLLNQA